MEQTTTGRDSSSFAHNKAFSDSSYPRVIKILSEVYPKCRIEIASQDADRREATDLIIHTKPKKTIGVRTRTFKREDWCQEFTIRCRSLHGKKTEYDKILEGHGDLIFLGFIKDKVINPWYILNLNVFRKEYLDGHPKLQYNKDGTAFFAYKFSAFSSDLIEVDSEHFYKTIQTED